MAERKMLWFWDYGGETGHLIKADTYAEAEEIAINKRME